MIASTVLRACLLTALVSCWLLCANSAAAQANAAQAAPPTAIPSVLVPWIPWVLDDVGSEQCTLVKGVRNCVWPSALTLDANATGATFTLTVSTDRKGSITLPGSAEHFPLDVRVGAEPMVVIEPSGVPEVVLPAGAHTISGRFQWAQLPDSIQAPVNLGTLLLSVRGQKVSAPKREASGLIWLAQGQQSDAEAERLELSVHRRIEDGIPMRVITRIQVSAAGTAREVVLPKVLLEGSRPIELRAELPAQLASDGSLRLQAQAGSYRIEVVAIVERSVSTLRAPKAEAPWPEREYWVFAADDALRHVELPTTGQIDPARTDLAADWHNLQTFVVPTGGSLSLSTRRRGQPDPRPNELTLTRSLWLDLDGQGYTVRDSLSGQMYRDFRLDLNAGPLGHAVVDGKDELVTAHGKATGIELRRGTLALDAEWRMENAARDLPAVGWSEDMQSLSARLHLPPGYLLLGTEGVDRVPGTWLDRWDLWDFFFVLLVALAVGKLAGIPWGLLALCTLVLSHHEPDAPAAIWLWLLAATALARVVTTARWVQAARIAWFAGLVVLLLIAVPFSVAQLRKAIYPHVDPTHSFSAPSQYAALVTQELQQAEAPLDQAVEERAAVQEMLMQEEEGRPSGGAADSPASPVSSVPTPSREGMGKKAQPKSKRSYAYDQNDVDPQAVVQTGPGVPSWTWQEMSLTWSGPVERDQRIKLWLVPPAATRIWALLTVLLNFALLLALARAAKRSVATRAAPTSSAPPAALTLLLLSLWPVTSAQAQAPRPAEIIPPAEVLAELKAKLLKPAACEPNCVSVPRLALRVEGTRLVLRAEVHAGAQGAYQAPGPLESFSPDTIKLDGKAALAAVRLDDGFLHVRVGPGRHSVELSGPLPPSQTLTLALGTAPHRVDATAPGFVIEGLRADGRAEGSLALRREVALDPALGAEQQTLMQWLEVKRHFDLGVRFRVLTTLRRLGPATDSMLVRLPLLPGETVTEAGLTSEKGSVVIELARDQSELTFTSVLPPTPKIALRAAEPSDGDAGRIVRPWNEIWEVACSPLYHCTYSGLSPVTRLSANVVLPLYRPWPGETLVIEAERLEGAEGSSVTIDRATLELEPGSRIEKGTLALHVRTSRGATQRIKLPAQATLLSLEVGGTARTARVKDGSVELHLDPGSHDVSLSFRRPATLGQHYTSPSLRVGQALTNVTTTVNVPEDRWLLWAYGPSWGPAILFWGYLALVVLAALALGQVPMSPLKSHEWVLLGLGLTQVEAPIVLIVIGWLFSFAFRKQQKLDVAWVFNLRQITLVVFTLVALSCLAYAVHQGLVVQPDMQVAGMNSTNTVLNWYVDRTAGGFPGVGIVSLPIWVYKSLMLLWALWLAASLLRWLRWGFNAFRSDGAWQSMSVKPPPENPRVPPEQIEAVKAALAAKEKTKDDA